MREIYTYIYILCICLEVLKQSNQLLPDVNQAAILKYFMHIHHLDAVCCMTLQRRF